MIAPVTAPHSNGMTEPFITASAGQEDLADLLLAHVPDPGLHDTPVSGARVFRCDEPVGRAPCIYEPCIVVVLQGAKRGYLGAETFEYTPGKYLVFAVPQPMESEIIRASGDKPFLGLALNIEPALIADLQMQISAEPVPESPRGNVIVSDLEAPMRDALARLFMTFNNETDARVIGPMLRREIFYRVLLGNQGSILRAAVHRNGHYHRINTLLRAIQADCSIELSTADMARMANMSKTLLHDSFKAITTLTPLQYVKTIRLHRARTLMLNDGASARTAASSTTSARSERKTGV